MRLLVQLVIAISTLAVVGCATAITVGSHVDRGLDFSRFRTYNWGPADSLPTGDPRLDKDSFFNDHVQGAVERQLAAKGLELTRSAMPELLIHYHATIARRMDVNRVDRGHGFCAGGDCPAEPLEYEAGTIVLDIVDARTNKLIWRGWAQNSVEQMLGDPDRMVKTIDEAIKRMLRRLPRPL
jgi:hypothetical protein